MNDLLCGYKQVPVTVYTAHGNVTTVVGMTYVKEAGRIMVFDTWINPSFRGMYDTVDQTRMIAEAFRQFSIIMRNEAPVYNQQRNWEGVCYG